MMSQSLNLAFSWTTLAIIAFLCVPAVATFLNELHYNRPRDRFYEDRDGCGTPDTIAKFSNRNCKFAILFCSATGLVISIVILVLEFLGTANYELRLETGLLASSWGVILVHGGCIATTQASVRSYNLGLCLLASATTLSLFSFSQSILQASRPDSYEYPVNIAWVINNITSLVLAVISISIPRRPDVTFQGYQVDPQRTVSVLYRYTWSWIEPLLRKASLKGDLDEDDLPHADYTLRSEELQKKWDDMKPQGTLLRSLVWGYKETLGTSWIVTIVRCLVSILPFWIMMLTLDILEDRETKGSHQLELLGLISGIAIFNLLDAWMEGWLFWHSLSELSLPIRAQLSSLVFDKSLRLKDVRTANKEDDRSRQSIVNLVGVDTERIAYFMQFQFLIANGIIKLVIFSALLIRIIGWIPFTAGISAWLLVMPASTWFSNLLLAQSKNLMHLRDSKLTKFNEVLLGLRQIKLSALEQQWEAKIIALRKLELHALWKYFVADCGLFGCWVLSHTFLAAISLAVYVFVNGTLSPSVAFVSLGILSALESTLETLPELITLGIDTLVSISRIGAYLSRPNIQNAITQGCSINFQKATISWPLDYRSVDEGRFTLKDLDISFPNGQLSVIAGKTGSGKSLLMSAILGETDLLEGHVCVPRAPEQTCYDIMHPENWITPGSLAYVSQTPWLENGSLRDNILFGLHLVKERYDQVIEACALSQDLGILADGDATELGANGVNLSGGQKWRVTLARAIYSMAEILVLEDIFCAVDTHVARWILEKCINGSLCEGRTRILVTHNLGLVLSAAAYIVELHEGTAVYAGRPQRETDKVVKSNTSAASDTNENLTIHIENINDRQMENLSPLEDSPRKFVLDERREVGTVKSRVYLTYLEHSGGILLWSICAFLFFAYQISIVGRAWWVRIWTSESISSEPSGSKMKSYSIVSPYLYHHRRPNQPSVQSTDQDIFFYLNIYIITSMAMVVIAIIRHFWIYFLSIKASKTIFNKMLFTVLHAPLQWLEAMPTGRIINRFTTDLIIIDQRIPLSWIMFFTNLLRLIGICVACISTCSYLLVPTTVLLLLGILIGKRYLQASRPLKRLESVSKSPVFDLFNTTLTGISTIRASKKTQTYLARMHRHIDMWTMTTFYIWLANRWMSFRMALLAAAFCITVGLFIVLNTSIDAALAGFMLAFVLDFSESMRWTVRCYGDMELDMNSMERVDEYMNIETESLSGTSPLASWPSSGAIQFCNLDVAYGPSTPLILRGITFEVRHNERVAVVGRTGAGKSSLALALFRCLETRGGSIIIDGLDISQLNLHSLRSQLAIIPQDPVLFSGTIRSNLDPFDEHTDDDIYAALVQVQLIQNSPGIMVRNHDADNNNAGDYFFNLYSPISESGGNLSQGQRQLLSIARAIISRPKIIVFDEATSAVDQATDALVQRSIRKSFPNSTLIVIAHRLSTISDFDKVLVLDNGYVKEFGTPLELWEREGMFRSMCESNTPNSYKKLRSSFIA